MSKARLVLSFFDITTLRKAEKRLHQVQRMETVGLMAGGVAHDLNNTLSGLVTYPQILLLDLPEDSKMRKPIESIMKSGKQAADVVEDLLTVARGAASGREIIDLNEIVENYLQSTEYQSLLHDYPHVEFAVNLSDSVRNISCSPVHIRKCLVNLLVNGFESVGKDGKCIIETGVSELDGELAEQLQVSPGNYDYLKVIDNGQGISAEDLQHIFEPFYTKKKMGKSGTGLGLAVVWNTMQDHLGAVTVESSSEGTCFTLYFPITTETVLLKAETVSLENLNGSQQKILVVDDDKNQLEITSKVLEALNYKAFCVDSGENAIDYLKNSDVDVVVLDMVMEPGMSGYETFKEIGQFKPTQKAIVVSGYSRSEDVNKTLALGAEGYVKKPYTMEQLGVALKKVL